MFIIDTREQKPLPMTPSVRKKLEVGDYTTKKLYNKFHVERKSLGDLYGTITKGNNRFKYELFRAAWHRIDIVVVVEGTYLDFINKRFPKGNERKVSKGTLEKLIATFEKKYFLRFIWCRSRRDAKKAISTLFSQKK